MPYHTLNMWIQGTYRLIPCPDDPCLDVCQGHAQAGQLGDMNHYNQVILDQINQDTHRVVLQDTLRDDIVLEFIIGQPFLFDLPPILEDTEVVAEADENEMIFSSSQGTLIFRFYNFGEQKLFISFATDHVGFVEGSTFVKVD